MVRKIVKYQVDEKKYTDTREIFDSLFGKALRILFRRENLEDQAEKYEKKSLRKRKKSKSSQKGEAAKGARTEAEVKPDGTETLETLKQDQPRSDGKPRKETEKRYRSPIKYEKSEKSNVKTIVKEKRRRRRRKMSKNQPKVGSNKRRTMLVFVLFLVLAGAYFYYQSAGDFSKFTEYLRSIKKETGPLLEDAGKAVASLSSKIKGIIQPEAEKNVRQKPTKKPSQIARKPISKKQNPPPSRKATPQKNLLIVKKPQTPAVKETPKPTPKPSYRPAVRKPSKPAPKPSYRPVVKPTQKPAAQVSRPPAVKESPKLAAHTPKKEVSSQGSHLPAKPPVSYPYSVYLGSYGSLERAKKAISMHEKKGLSPYWVEVDLGEKGIWFRIFAGYFLNKAKAEAYIDEKQITDAKSKPTKFANLIGVYHSQHELNRKRVSLSKLGYSPYVVAGVNGESLLYTGAFYQRARADKQHTQLASRGIRSRVVMR